MIYQVLTRGGVGAAWVAYSNPTGDPLQVVLLIQAANQQYAEVTVLQAESVAALTELLRQVRGGRVPAQGVSPLPGLTGTPRVRVEDPPMERRRWEMEQGKGGDHDEPYAYRPPASTEVMAAWMRLLARRWRERQPGGQGGAAA